ncbi:linear amide C-N hydrolase [Gloeothece verrucosa]|uniref:Choloylglycine hydrolase n=1 Tax=Gloeothece verrucosa (strain PCC 7822) TaxID=497965 RepID=E0UMW9_GLOV7|nr:linear amide C-N hydrolase [Gloeothece verrucosa]ADN18299.1 Choloylglycine hydrolase [Gloeothece verrucosa PCC 7822]
MCTRVLWTGNIDGKFYPICGRNMDWGADMAEKLWVFPAGLQRQSAVEGDGIEWISKYGSIVTSVYNQAVADGMNTAGLAIHSNWLTESYYGERDPKKPGLDCDRAVQYFLDNFATVSEVVEYLRNNEDLQIVPTKIKVEDIEREIKNHLAIEDAQGESAIVEYLKTENGGVQRNIYYSGDLRDYSIEYNVLSNSPPFKDQLLNLKQYKGFGGDLHLPGTSDSADRFVRAAFYLKSLPQPTNHQEAIAGVLSVMRSVAQPFRVPESGEPYASSTRWRTIVSCQEKLYLYESSFYPTLVWLEANKLNFAKGSGVRVFDLTNNRQAIGDVSGQLTDTEDLFKN